MMSKESIKQLQSIVSEPDELKRYVLMQLWTQQFFTNSITDPIKRFTDTLNSNSDYNSSSLYDLCRDIKIELQHKNKGLKDIAERMKRNRDILLVLSDTLELGSDVDTKSIQSNIAKLQAQIDINEQYVSRLNKLSEDSIEQILNGPKQTDEHKD